MSSSSVEDSLSETIPALAAYPSNAVPDARPNSESPDRSQPLSLKSSIPEKFPISKVSSISLSVHPISLGMPSPSVSVSACACLGKSSMPSLVPSPSSSLSALEPIPSPSMSSHSESSSGNASSASSHPSPSSSSSTVPVWYSSASMLTVAPWPLLSSSSPATGITSVPEWLA